MARRQLRRLLSKSGLRPLRVRLRHRGLRAHDIALASYPRSGNTWVRFLLFALATGERGGFGEVEAAIPYVGAHRDAPALLPTGGRLFKTHESAPHLYDRALFLVRDIRDVARSEHRYQRKFGFVDTDFDTFLDLFLHGEVHGLGTWVEHTNRWLDAIAAGRHVELVRYEDLHADTERTVAGIAHFLGLPDDHSRIIRAIEASSLDAMQAAEDRSSMAQDRPDLRHVGSGRAGGWRSHLRPDQVAVIEAAAGSTLTRLGYPTGDALEIGPVRG